MGQGLRGQGLRGLEGRSQKESGVAIEAVVVVDVGVGGRAGVGQVKGELELQDSAPCSWEQGLRGLERRRLSGLRLLAAD